MIELSRKRGHPVYLQIKEQLERRIAAGTLEEGDALPSVRALAKQLGINPNTVVRAYRELESAGLVESRHGEGTFVAGGESRQESASKLLLSHAVTYARASQELGVDLNDAQAALKQAWDEETNQ